MSEQGFVLPEGVDPNFPFWVTEEDDGTITVHWDPDHKITSVFNTWEEQDFVDLLMSRIDEVLNQFDESKE